ncbi:MAG: hypothetical protein ABW202_11290 [Duganella sp.]
MATGLRQTLLQLGWFDACLYWLGRLLIRASGGRWSLHRYRYVAQYIGPQPLLGAHARGRGRDIAIHLHAAPYPVSVPWPRPPSAIASRHAQGAYSLVALRHGKLAGFLWLIDAAYQEDEVRARFCLAGAEACWDFDVWVDPEERLGMVFARLWEAARVLLRARGVRWSCSRISAFNPASLRAHAAIGVVPLGAALFLRCAGWQWTFANIAPYVHLSRSASCCPEFRFDTRSLADLTLPEPPCPPKNSCAPS